MKVEVKCADRVGSAYDIVIGNNILEDKLLKYHSRYLIFIVDKNVDFTVKLQSSWRVIKLEKESEELKTFTTFEWLCEKLCALGISRDVVLVAVGGGSVGDLVGFVASAILRGVSFLQVPTTLLSMVDSSVGGKVAINSSKLKNMIGSFYQPIEVICDIKFLNSLPKEELASGYAEVLKYGLMRDAEFLEYLLNNEDNILKVKHLEYIIEKSCRIKTEIVSLDEMEINGIRALLNFGHTFGHAIEKKYLLKHGYAVAIGMIMAIKFSGFVGLLSNVDNLLLKLRYHYSKVGLMFDFDVDYNEMLVDMSFDKKNISSNTLNINGKNLKSNINLILLEAAGKSVIKSVDTLEIIEFFKTIS